MRTVNWKGAVARSLLGLAALLVVPMVGATPAMAEKVNPSVGAVLYEVAEDAYFLDANGMPTGDPDKIVLRVATAQLTGWVELGTPLCPSEFLLVYPKAKRCALNAIGTDYVSLQGDQPGTGPVSGVFSVVIQGDNPTDGPEGVALTGTFTGTVDLSPALAGTPIGFLTGGVFQVDPGPFSQGGSFAFTGTFRLPFSLSQDGSKGPAWGNRAAFYLTDNGRPDRVRQDERAIGWATVRLEIEFQ